MSPCQTACAQVMVCLEGFTVPQRADWVQRLVCWLSLPWAAGMWPSPSRVLDLHDERSLHRSLCPRDRLLKLNSQSAEIGCCRQ